MINDLTDSEIVVIQACLHAASDGPFFPEWEFQTLFGFTRDEFRKTAAGFPRFKTGEVRRVIDQAFNNLIGYPHGHEDDEIWRAWIPISRKQFPGLESRWGQVRELWQVPHSTADDSDA